MAERFNWSLIQYVFQSLELLSPSLMNKMLRYLNYSTWWGNSFLTLSGHSTLFQLRNMALDFDVHILIPAASNLGTKFEAAVTLG